MVQEFLELIDLTYVFKERIEELEERASRMGKNGKEIFGVLLKDVERLRKDIEETAQKGKRS